MDEKLGAAAKEMGIGLGADPNRKSPLFIRLNGKKSWFPTEEKRELALKIKLAEIRKYGAATQVSDQDRQLIIELKRRAAEAGTTVLSLFEKGLESVSGISIKRISIEHGVAAYLREQEGRMADESITAQHLRTTQHVMNRLVKSFGHSQIMAMDRPLLHKHLQHTCAAVNTRNLHARIIRSFFNWAIENHMAERNPTPKTTTMMVIPPIFTADQTKRFFEVVAETHPETTPMFALQWFAGMRPEATQNIDWKAISFEHRQIAVSADINKTREPELIEDLPPDQIWEWLAPYRKESGRVAPENWRRAMLEIHHKLGYNAKIRWPADVARHSFASHLVPVYRSLDRVARVLLHRGTTMLMKHYMAKHVTRQEGEAYLALRPNASADTKPSGG